MMTFHIYQVNIERVFYVYNWFISLSGPINMNIAEDDPIQLSPGLQSKFLIEYTQLMPVY
jgi:hypothetical protein